MKTTKFFSVILATVMLFNIFAVLYVNAETTTLYPTGALEDDWDAIPDPPMVTIEPMRWGDLNADEKVTSADARLCLRAAAKLETLTDDQKYAADIYGDGKITSRNARKILRVAARLDIFDCYHIDILFHQKIKVANLKSSGSLPYSWHCYVDSGNDVQVDHDIIDNNPPGNVGGPTYDQFIINDGFYNVVKFQHKWGNETPIKEFVINVTIH